MKIFKISVKIAVDNKDPISRIVDKNAELPATLISLDDSKRIFLLGVSIYRDQ